MRIAGRPSLFTLSARLVPALVLGLGLGLAVLPGCMSLHAELPEDMVRQMARKDGVDLGALCLHDGRTFSEGAMVCMAQRDMTCDPTGRWVQGDAC